MPDTENCGRIPRKIPKTWSVEVVVGELIIIPIDIEMFFLVRPEKPLLYIGSAGALSSII